MKLTDLVYTVTSRYRVVETFIRHPFQILEQRGRRAFQDKLENIELPINQRQSKSSEREAGRSPDDRPHPIRSEHSVSTVPQAGPPQAEPFLLNGSRAAARTFAVEETPLLSEQEEIRGRWGRYRRVGAVLKVEPAMRLYSGVLVLNDKPVVIKEYLLPEREFNAREVRSRKEAFALLAGLNLRNSDSQDFRLVVPWDVIAPLRNSETTLTNPNERRCYLITEPTNNSIPLGEFLAAKQSPMSAQQVRQVLNQVLQTLWFLHNQRVRLPSGEVLSGIAHGNLNLHSLLLVQTSQFAADELQFLIYVTDLALWEHLFEPPTRRLPQPTFAQDLIDLGNVTWQLLHGSALQKPLTLNQQALDLSSRTSTASTLEQFIQQLIQGSFRNDVEAARQALLRLPSEDNLNQTSATVESDSDRASDSWRMAQRLRMLLLLGLLGGCLGGLLWLSWRWLKGSPPWMATTPSTTCCLTKVPNLPTARVTYVAQADGIWSDILQRSSLVAYGKTLEQELKSRDARLNGYTLQWTTGDVIDEVRSGRAEFALAEWHDRLPSDLIQQEVAFDGLAVVVAFSDAKRAHSIPDALQGKIDFEQLRQLYTDAGSWQAPNSLRNWKIKRYLSNDPTVVKQFERQVLKGRSLQSGITKAPENRVFGEILKEFEAENTLGIGVARLSKVLEQCSVYPLAIGEKHQELQALVQDNGKPVDPTTNLCNDKGSYWLNPNVFNPIRNFWQPHYPLTYRLVVIYRKHSKAGERFAAALKTDEGQALLRAAGLVPLNPLSKN